MRIYVYMYMHILVHLHSVCVAAHVCSQACVSLRAYVCMNLCVYIHTYLTLPSPTAAAAASKTVNVTFLQERPQLHAQRRTVLAQGLDQQRCAIHLRLHCQI